MRPNLALPLLMLLAPLALASSADPLVDPAGDCAVPYGGAYLDIVAARVEAENETDFDVALELAAYNDALAEGAGFTVQFEHQGIRWGIVAYRSDVVASAPWRFFTGRASSERVDVEGFEPTTGALREGAAPTLVATFPKSLFPHADASDVSLRGFEATSVDLRPAYPMLAAGLDASGRWVVCDEARGDGEYVFAAGGHSHEHPAAADTAVEPDAPVGDVSGSDATGAPVPRETPAASLATVLVCALGAAWMRRG